jgi:outer membrane protein OmpA-like peptidoglycan-associated protein
MSARCSWWKPVALALVALTVANPSDAQAQFGKRLKDAMKRKAEDKAIEKATTKEGAVIDTLVDGKPKPASSASNATEAGGTMASTGGSAPTSRKEWANYDFVPGNRVLFFTDFSEDQVGNFPKRLEFKTGQVEVVELDGGQRALKASSYSQILVPLPEKLPEKFTLEVDVINRDSRGVAANTFEIAGGKDIRDAQYTQVGWGHNGGSAQGGGVDLHITAKDADIARYVGKPASVRLLADGKYVKLYADEKRWANIPNAGFKRDKVLVLDLHGRDDEKNAVYVTRIRVAESEKTIYDELASKGRWSTQGILFDTGKSDVKPESTPTLKLIAATLKEHGDLKLEIQGHTDNVGKADANLKLSDARAAAVKAALVKDYGVTDDQLTTRGYGDTKPMADNKTPEGRANNRRVELVKQ